MPPILSTNGYIGVGKQTTFGTPVAPTAGLFIKYLSEGLVNEQEDLKAAEGGFGRYTIEAYKSTHKVSGDVSFYARPDVLGFFLNMLMGKDTYVAAVGGVSPAQHTIEVATPHFFTLERGIDPATPTIVERFQDLHVSDLTIEGESSQPIKCTASLIGTKGVVQVAASTPTYEANDPIMFFDTPTYTVDGGGTVEISKFSFKISNNFDIWFGTTITPAEIIEKLLTIEVNFTLKFLNATHYKKVYYNAGTAIVDTIADGSFRVQAGYGALDAIRSLDINLKHIKHIGAPVNLSGEASPIMQECVGYAIKPGADNLLDVVIKNSFAADYDV